MNGTIDLLDKRPIFQLVARGENIRLQELQLAPQYSNSTLGFILSANFEGNNLDNAEGVLSIDTPLFNNNGKIFSTRNFHIEAHNEQTPQSVSIESDLISGRISADILFNTLKDSFTRMLASALPSLIQPPTSKQVAQNNFTFNFEIQNSNHLSDVLELPFYFKKSAKISGFFSDENRNFRIEGNLPEFQIKTCALLRRESTQKNKKENISFQLGAMLLNKQDKQIHWNVAAKSS